jgi:hypothetical protein
MTGDFPRPGTAMMATRKAAFDGRARPERFDLSRFFAQDVYITADDCRGVGRAALVATIVDRVATHPDGSGVGYCLVGGLAALMPVEAARKFSATLFADVWARYRTSSRRITDDREFYEIETLTRDGAIPTELFGARWSFKPPHADRNGVLFAHVYGPSTGFGGGDVLLIDALAYTKDLGLSFDQAMKWSDDPGSQKPVLRPEHVEPALSSHGRRFGQLSPDSILIVNNDPEGLLHGATELEIANEQLFTRYLHRIVVRERDGRSTGFSTGLSRS